MTSLRDHFQVERKTGDGQAMRTYLAANVTPADMAGTPLGQSPTRKERVSGGLQAKVDAMMRSIDGFCDRHLNAEYRQLILAAVCALARKRPSPLLGCSWMAASWTSAPCRYTSRCKPARRG
jgi:hypothetical protein